MKYYNKVTLRKVPTGPKYAVFFPNAKDYYSGKSLWSFAFDTPPTFQCYHKDGCSKPNLSTSVKHYYCMECGSPIQTNLNEESGELLAADRQKAKNMVRNLFPSVDLSFYR